MKKRIGQMVSVQSRCAKQAIGFPEHGTLVGRVECVLGDRAIVKVRKGTHVAVGINELTEI